MGLDRGLGSRIRGCMDSPCDAFVPGKSYPAQLRRQRAAVWGLKLAQGDSTAEVR